MRTMSLFSLNRIYKPNRHTPTPLTQTHTISFPSLSLTPSLCASTTTTQTHSWDRLCEDFISGSKRRKKVRVIACDGVKSWVQAAAVGEWTDGWLEGTFCSSCAGADSHIVPWLRPARVSFMIQGPQPLSGGEQDMGHCDVPCTRFSKKHQIKHAWDGDRGGPATSIFTPSSLCTLVHSLVPEKKRKQHLMDCVSRMFLDNLRLKWRLFRNRSLVNVWP